MGRLALPLLVFLLCPAEAAALRAITVQAGPAAGHGWSVQKLQASLRFGAGDAVAFRIEASGVRLPEPLDSIRALRADCADATLGAKGFRCRGGAIEITNTTGVPRLEPASFELEYRHGRFRLDIDGLRTGHGDLDIHAAGSERQWLLETEVRGLPLSAIVALAGHRLPVPPLNVASGKASGSLRWRLGRENGSLTARLRVSELSFSDGAGLNAGENVEINADIEARRGGGPWRYSIHAALSGGQVYLHPLFFDAGAHAVSVEAEGDFEASSGEVRIKRFGGSHENLLALSGSALLKVDKQGLHLLEAEADARVAELKGFHAVYLEPWLVGSALAGAELGGGIGASLSWRAAGSSHATVTLEDVSIDDAQARYGLLGLNGVVRWSNERQEEPSRLAWQGAHFYRIDIGASQILGRFTGRRFELDEPALFPLLGGILAVDSLGVDALGTGASRWRFSGRLTPVSLADLTNRLAWPAFSGSLSGVIPSVRYADGQVTVDGTLAMEVFDGTVLISDLELSQPFGVVPRVSANVKLSNLSLDALTRTFSFGNIQGRLDGRIDNLVLENWKPAEFDAEFATPEGDTSRHRISQRAVENLASLGGAGRVLSSTVLRFLESFSYDRLGIRCRLRNGVCEMGGVESAERGYYIVKGGGIPPRIDVLGFNDRVDWNKLVERLRSARLDRAVVQ